jgi:hypothetical protein
MKIRIFRILRAALAALLPACGGGAEGSVRERGSRIRADGILLKTTTGGKAP